METKEQTDVIDPNLAAGLIRLVNVFYWSGWTVVAVFLLGTIAFTIAAVVQPPVQPDERVSLTVTLWVFCAFSAIVWWGFCRICRYVWKGSDRQ
jgi:hypothetical protein